MTGPLVAQGMNGRVVVENGTVVLLRLKDGVVDSERTRWVPLDHLTAVEYRDAGYLRPGRIQFCLPGARVVTGFLEAARDDHTIQFSLDQQPDMLRVRDHLVEQLRRQWIGRGAASDVLTDVRRLAELRDMGAISEVEFTDKKTVLLERL